MRRPSFISRTGSEKWRGVRSGDVAAEDAEFAGGGADFGKGLVEASDIGGFDVDEELVFPGTAVDRAAFDLQQIHTVFGERFEGGEKGARAVSEAHGQRDFAGIG